MSEAKTIVTEKGLTTQDRLDKMIDAILTLGGLGLEPTGFTMDADTLSNLCPVEPAGKALEHYAEGWFFLEHLLERMTSLLWESLLNLTLVVGRLRQGGRAMINESTYSRIVQGVKKCNFGSEENIHCRDCPYLGYGCGEKLRDDLLHFLDFFSTVDGWAEALGLKRFVSGGENND